jgi:NAD(P)-dependent dehydrogenase (short-subunit alcohol dehydrogenase family)
MLAGYADSCIICVYFFGGARMNDNGLKRVFITGGASGLGLALALRFAREGWRVAIGDINNERLESARAEIETYAVPVLTLHCDITSDEDVAAAVREIESQWRGLDVLVNNAGVAAAGTLLDTSLEDWRWMIDINLLGAIRVSRAFLPLMERNGSGHLINVASVAGIVQSPGMASYNVAKAGMIALSETLRNELRGSKIGVTVVCPSFFTTNLLESYRAPDPTPRNIAEKLMDRSRLSADDIAEATWRGMTNNDFYVFGHNEAWLAYQFKRFLPGLFSLSTYKAAGRLFGKSSEGAEPVNGKT